MPPKKKASRKPRRRYLRKSAPKRRSKTRRRGLWGYLWRGGLVLAVLFALYTVYLDFEIRQQFEGKRWSLPARVFARPLELHPGLALGPEELERELSLLGYRRVYAPEEPGTFRRDGDSVVLATRGFAYADDVEPSRRLKLRFDAGSVQSMGLAGGGAAPPLARLEPVLIANIYPQHNEDRLLVRIEDVPPLLTQGLLAIEDRRFYEHHGIDPTAIGRALIANLRAGRTVQGGSTITQQLVKNFFLSNERTLRRKFNEAIMSLLLEWHYDKDEILEAYLNEIYLGQDGQRSINGFGLASQFYFQRPLADLDVERLALLVALVRGASYYDPRRHGERARTRRNLVLDQWVEAGLIDAAIAARAKGRPLGVSERTPSGVTPFPGYLDLVRTQLRRDYRDEDLRSEGLFIFTNFDPLIQLTAEAAVKRRLDSLGKGLEAAVVVASAEQGEVVAVVGGRDPRFAGFNRALEAQRPIGSLVKPAVFLTALEQPEAYTLATLVDDGPLEVVQRGGEPWTPQNYDHEHHGQVMLLDALVHSYNVATARVGLAVGLPEVVDTLHRLGVAGPVNPYPSLLLGATELAPLEVAQMYQTLSAGGYRAPLRAIREVKDRNGQTLQRYGLEVERATSGAGAYLIGAALHEVTRRGTAASLTTLLPDELPVAGKTGTTDDLRDSWFAGFSGEHVAVVWVGRDDNQPVGLTGASGALPLWADIMRGIHTRPLRPVQPDNVEWVQIDPQSGLRAEDGCPGAQWLPFIQGSAPESLAPCADGVGRGIKRTFRWFKDLFQ